ncbi:unnamed protein product [Microthlaspi erraticum]|uniref:DNA topoisomerase I n=1 Tax=Microthlaspi erraticum TaxID=1685480 RepID=A0A6D2I9K3_9BRAS|nr:unnamed protein product [Microthlaspi erraticum]
MMEDDGDGNSLVFKRSVNDKDQSHRKPFDNKRDDEKKPLVRKLQNGSTLEDGAKVSWKRLLDKGSYVDQSSMKKPKTSSSSYTSVATKQDYVEKEKQGDKRKKVVVSPKQDETAVDDNDDDDDVPIAKRIKSDSSNSKTPSTKGEVVKQSSTSSAMKTKAIRVVSPPAKTRSKESKKVTNKDSKSLPNGDGKKKWTTLEHNGVTFPPPYKPHGVATLFAVMRETEYYSKPRFRENFWNDWRKLLGKNHVIQKLDDCDFTPIYDWNLEEKKRKKESKEKKPKQNEKEKYMWAIIDGVKEKIANFQVEPPALFRGRGDHPKIGKLKKRIYPHDVTLILGKDAPIPECPIPGERWKEIKHDNTLMCIAYWNNPIYPKLFKYVNLAASSSLKGHSDKQKYEKARKLKDHIDSIRATYTKNFTAKDVSKRQIAVAIYLIDKLALRAGNEKDDDEADTVGCCTLKLGHVECVPPNKLKFDFLGKDSIQYVNTVEVDPPVYKAIGQFQAGKSKSDDLFDKLDTSKLNAHLKELMPGLTAKVFRTYNASITLDVMLRQETKDGDVSQKLAVYNQANKEVAIICNHQRTVSKSHGAQVQRLAGKLDELREGLKQLKTNLERAKKGKLPLEGSDGKKTRNITPEAWEKKIAQNMMKTEKMERDMESKEDLKTVALGTSKINYMDPRITVAWCKRHEVPIQKTSRTRSFIPIWIRNQTMAFLATSLIFAVVGIIASICTRICFNKGPSTNLLHLTLVITATVCCWMMWAIVYIAQMKPLIVPILSEVE